MRSIFRFLRADRQIDFTTHTDYWIWRMHGGAVNY